MPNRFLSRVQRQWLISLLVVAVAVRALIPAGFMPSADRPLTFQICPDGFPAQLLHGADELGPQAGHAMHDEHAAHHARGGEVARHDGHGSHDHGAARAEHCVFAAVASVGPAPQVSLLLTPIEGRAAPRSRLFSPAIELTRYRVQQPRGPPALS